MLSNQIEASLTMSAAHLPMCCAFLFQRMYKASRTCSIVTSLYRACQQPCSSCRRGNFITHVPLFSPLPSLASSQKAGRAATTGSQPFCSAKRNVACEVRLAVQQAGDRFVAAKASLFLGGRGHRPDLDLY